MCVCLKPISPAARYPPSGLDIASCITECPRKFNTEPEHDTGFRFPTINFQKRLVLFFADQFMYPPLYLGNMEVPIGLPSSCGLHLQVPSLRLYIFFFGGWRAGNKNKNFVPIQFCDILQIFAAFLARMAWRPATPTSHTTWVSLTPETLQWLRKWVYACVIQRNLIGLYIYHMIQPPLVPPHPPPKGGIRHTYAAMYRYNYMFVLIYVCMPVCLTVCLLVCKYVRVPARSTCHCFCVCTQRYYMYT